MRCRFGQRPQSQPSPSSASDEAMGADEEARPVSSQGFKFNRRKARASSAWSNDGSSLDVVDVDELDQDVILQQVLKSPLGSTKTFVNKNKPHRSRNPFVEF